MAVMTITLSCVYGQQQLLVNNPNNYDAACDYNGSFPVTARGNSVALQFTVNFADSFNRPAGQYGNESFSSIPTDAGTVTLNDINVCEYHTSSQFGQTSQCSVLLKNGLTIDDFLKCVSFTVDATGNFGTFTFILLSYDSVSGYTFSNATVSNESTAVAEVQLARDITVNIPNTGSSNIYPYTYIVGPNSATGDISAVTAFDVCSNGTLIPLGSPPCLSAGATLSPATVTGTGGASMLGDPVFKGLYGQKYQVHGIDGAVYTVVSDKFAHVNALFTFLSEGECPSVAGTSKTCWSHPGSYIGAITYQSRDGHRLLIRAGNAETGFSALQFDGADMSIGTAVDTTNSSVLSRDDVVDGIRFEYRSSHRVRVSASAFDYEIENSDRFLNLLSVRVRDWTALTTRIKSHGLLGQTWHKRKGGVGVRARDVKAVEGEYDDYANADAELFGVDNLYARFK